MSKKVRVKTSYNSMQKHLVTACRAKNAVPEIQTEAETRGLMGFL